MSKFDHFASYLVGSLIVTLGFSNPVRAANGARFESLEPNGLYPFGIEATSVSGDGNAVVGVIYLDPAQENTHAFIWRADSGLVDLGSPYGDAFPSGRPQSLTESGDAFVTTRHHWSASSGFFTLPSPTTVQDVMSGDGTTLRRRAASGFNNTASCGVAPNFLSCFDTESTTVSGCSTMEELLKQISIDGRISGYQFQAANCCNCGAPTFCDPCVRSTKYVFWLDDAIAIATVESGTQWITGICESGNCFIITNFGASYVYSLWTSQYLSFAGDGFGGIPNANGTIHYQGTNVWRADFGKQDIQVLLESLGGIDLAGWDLTRITDISYDGRVVVGNGIDPQGNETAWRAVLPNPGIPQPFGIVADKAVGAVRVVNLATGAVVRTFDDVGGGLVYPNGVVADAAHRAFVADVTNDRVVQFELLSGEVVRIIDGGGLDAPVDVIVSPNNTLLVASFATGNVKEYDLLDGSFMRDVMPANSGGLDGAAGMALTDDGALYVCSQRTDQVLEFDYTTGAFVRVAAEGCTLDAPGDVVVREDGSLLVTSFNTDEVLAFSPSGVCTGCYSGAALNGPEGLSLNLDGTVVVSNRYGGGVTILDADDCSLVRTISPGILEPTYVATLDAYAIDCNMNDIPDEWEIANGTAFDCNGNNFLDSCEIALGYNGATDPDGDGIIGSCTPPRIPGDMNCDGVITVSDVGGFVLSLTNASGYVNQFPACDPLHADLNNDGAVSVTDIGLFVALLVPA